MLMMVAQGRDHKDRIVDATCVIGPSRINHCKIMPVIDYTAGVIGQLLG